MEMNNQLWTQCRQIVCWLLEHGSITQRDAAVKLNCWRLGARIWDLRNELGTEVITTKNEKHDGGVHARYCVMNSIKLSIWLADQENKK